MIQSPIKSDESLIFFPTYGTLDEAAAMWRANVHGWIYERSLLGGIALVSFRAGLDLPFQPETDALFLQRAWAFSVDNERGKAIPIVFDLDAEPERVTLAASTANGHINDVVELPRDHVRDVLGNDIAHVKYHAVVGNGDDRAFSGQVRLLPPQGVSVISDIDDTIKISDVTDRSELLRNTFLRPFQPVPDIAARYTAWHDEAPANTGFHYVTAAPWQLFSPLTGFLSESAFPDGIMHMKLFRPKDSTFWDLFKEQTVYKTEIIGHIFRDFPGRKFVLVGDSGEQDPEVYGAIARKYPRQVAAIMIRNLTGLDRGRAVCHGLRQGARWHVAALHGCRRTAGIAGGIPLRAGARRGFGPIWLPFCRPFQPAAHFLLAPIFPPGKFCWGACNAVERCPLGNAERAGHFGRPKHNVNLIQEDRHMFKFTKVLVVAGLLVAAFSMVSVSDAKAGGWGCGYGGYGGYSSYSYGYSCYKPYVANYCYTPSYNYCYTPSYNYCAPTYCAPTYYAPTYCYPSYSYNCYRPYGYGW